MTPKEDAIAGLNMLKAAIRGHLEEKPQGATNTDMANALDLQSHSSLVDGKETGKNFLSHAVLGLMVRDGEVLKIGKRYFHLRYA
ncbi:MULTISPECIES: hypothetical protein [Rhizobium]|uniref:HTH HARE-type domain-containing protein n=1 Tax=Rhizobium rhododendri TaxID=2506430 RepID=A0ABY8IG43_9HYPH|nr:MULTISPECIES: hypothetical protein [Rhizobium]MBZ5759236.1 hypothetical protein [Rhizobium sp. VS19-DR96]MBZ5763933.1 hypothetical protein [Rhizobium sp. VS19-DR129.2]MBZ5771477.1 hypothetical protein [Rhizobium sp. VS19-DRK62.2]MBZ5783836.1 hypothetical protein [Rhizobium sp. VS19-DR121]MBZ5801490.1 hypothetical protein [Rhizobium sp. VS19-DR181]